VKQEAAYHEAGHAVIAGALGYKVRLVIIDPNGGGECQCDDPPEEERERKIMLCFAGPAAQRKHEPGSWKGWHGNDDYRKAVELVQGLGVSDERLNALIRETHGLVERHWARIERFAHVLLERGTLQAGEIDALLADCGT
jgi:ATP-dependent Zn protease